MTTEPKTAGDIYNCYNQIYFHNYLDSNFMPGQNLVVHLKTNVFETMVSSIRVFILNKKLLVNSQVSFYYKITMAVF